MSKLATKVLVRWVELVRPDGYPFHTVEQRFGILQWMVRTASAPDFYGGSGPMDLLHCKPTCVHGWPPVTVRALRAAGGPFTLSLERIFHHALLARHASPSAVRWRRENGIDITKKRWVYFPHQAYGDRRSGMAGESCRYTSGPGGLWSRGRSESDITMELETLFGTEAELSVQLNEFHDGARHARGVRVEVYPNRFRFVLSYGFPPPDSSSWDHLLAETDSGETFIETFDRALSCLKELYGGRRTTGD